MAKVKDCPGFETFGADVKEARKAKNLARKDLAEKVNIGFLSLRRFLRYSQFQTFQPLVKRFLGDADRISYADDPELLLLDELICGCAANVEHGRNLFHGICARFR